MERTKGKQNKMNTKKWKEKSENKEHLRKYARKYYEKNREELIQYQSDYQKEMIKLSKELGNCSKCYGIKDNPKYAMCLKCRIKGRNKK